MDNRARLRLALEVGCSSRTIDRWLSDPSIVTHTTRYALEQACARLGIALPVTEASAPTADPDHA